mmetsp:Transcript_51875/g.60640  ORF Transcript_51875/g.60640 Transcript_51875/m.60640 type:complete len:862 (-) Transcript_51875:63-2648(-)
MEELQDAAENADMPPHQSATKEQKNPLTKSNSKIQELSSVEDSQTLYVQNVEEFISSDAAQDTMVDITKILNEAVSSLSYADPLICNVSFDLHESMSALELMDPDMDSSCILNEINGGNVTICESENSPTLSNETTVDRKDASIIQTQGLIKIGVNPPAGLNDPRHSQLKWKDLTLKDAAVVALTTLSLIESFLDGSSVAESLYTSLYAHDAVLSDMKSEILYADKESNGSITAPMIAVFSTTLAAVKICECARTIIRHADIYEEEDFACNVYGFRFFFPDVSTEQEVCDYLNQAIKSVDKDTDADNSFKQVLLHVLRCKLFFFNAVTSMAKVSSATIEVTATTVQLIARDAVECFKHLESLLSTSSLGKNRSTFGLRAETVSDGSVCGTFLDTNINRPLLGNSPVRQVAFKPWCEMLASLRKVAEEMDWAVCNLLLKGSSLGRIRRMVRHISKASCNILNRSFVVFLLYFEDKLLGRHYLVHMIANAMCRDGVPHGMMTSTEYGSAFLNRLAKPIYDSLKVFLLNTCRQRTFIETLVLKGWSELHLEANAVDFYFREEHNLEPSKTPAFVSNWVLSQTVFMMEYHLGLGIELFLLNGHHDLAIAYWYWDFLLSTQLNLTTAMRNAKKDLKTISEESEKGIEHKPRKDHQGKGKDQRARSDKKKKGKSGPKGAKKQSQNVENALLPQKSQRIISPEDMEDEIEYLLLTLRRQLCRGIFRFIIILYQARCLIQPKFEFTSHRIRFMKRFQSFAKISQPPPLTYDDFLKGSDFSALKRSELLLSATESFRFGKTIVDKISATVSSFSEEFSPIRKVELKGLLRTVVVNSLNLHKLSQIEDSSANLKVELDFSINSLFCTFNIL